MTKFCKATNKIILASAFVALMQENNNVCARMYYSSGSTGRSIDRTPEEVAGMLPTQTSLLPHTRSCVTSYDTGYVPDDSESDWMALDALENYLDSLKTTSEKNGEVLEILSKMHAIAQPVNPALPEVVVTQTASDDDKENFRTPRFRGTSRGGQPKRAFGRRLDTRVHNNAQPATVPAVFTKPTPVIKATKPSAAEEDAIFASWLAKYLPDLAPHRISPIDFWEYAISRSMKGQLAKMWKSAVKVEYAHIFKQRAQEKARAKTMGMWGTAVEEQARLDEIEKTDPEFVLQFQATWIKNPQTAKQMLADYNDEERRLDEACKILGDDAETSGGYPVDHLTTDGR